MPALTVSSSIDSTGDDTVVSTQDDVYLDELVGVIDRMVEKNDSDEEYNEKRREWLAKKSL
jgi:uncharacterized protein YqeY